MKLPKNGTEFFLLSPQSTYKNKKEKSLSEETNASYMKLERNVMNGGYL